MNGKWISLLCVTCFVSAVSGNLRDMLGGMRCFTPPKSSGTRVVYRIGNNVIGWSPVGGSRVPHGTTSTVICKNDVQGDAILRWKDSKCVSGRWIPPMKVCKNHKRCRAPPVVQNAQASERITPYITFPHGTEVTYDCDAGTRMSGNTENKQIVCNDGSWSRVEIQCTPVPRSIVMQTPRTQHVHTTTKRPNVNFVIRPRGRCTAPPTVRYAKASERTRLSYSHGTEVTYRCDRRTRMIGQNKIVCNDGRWSRVLFKCRRRYINRSTQRSASEPLSMNIMKSHKNIAKDEGIAGCSIPEEVLSVSIIRNRATKLPLDGFIASEGDKVRQICRKRNGGRRLKRSNRCKRGKWRRDFMTCK